MKGIRLWCLACNTAAGVLLSCLSWCIDNTACGRVRVVYRAKQHSMTRSSMEPSRMAQISGARSMQDFGSRNHGPGVLIKI